MVKYEPDRRGCDMKAKVKRARRTMRQFKRIIYTILLIGALFFTTPWLHENYQPIEKYFKLFGRLKIDTAEIDAYYDLLSKNATPAKDLMLDLGVKESDGLQLVIDRLKGAMGLGEYKIWLAHHDAEKPPAYIKQLGYGDMSIMISKNIKERKEEINLLVHELGHIYVWKLAPSVFGKCDQEKLVDCSGVFLGLGVMMLNGMTDDFTLLPGQGYETRKKLFGYLTPEQLGYLLARYCAEHGIAEDAVRPFLGRAGQKYFDTGCEYLKKNASAIKRSSLDAPQSQFCQFSVV